MCTESNAIDENWKNNRFGLDTENGWDIERKWDIKCRWKIWHGLGIVYGWDIEGGSEHSMQLGHYVLWSRAWLIDKMVCKDRIIEAYAIQTPIHKIFL